jgi:hypothetical protein
MNRVCSVCGAVAIGLFPAGWLIEPIKRYVIGENQSMVVGERAVCPSCQSGGKPVEVAS